MSGKKSQVSGASRLVPSKESGTAVRHPWKNFHAWQDIHFPKGNLFSSYNSRLGDLSFTIHLGKTKYLSTDQNERINHTQGRSPVSEFRTQMLRAISKLSVSRQCSILTAILEDSGETLSHMIEEYKDTELYQQLPCTTKPSGSAVNTTGLRRVTDFYISRYRN